MINYFTRISDVLTHRIFLFSYLNFALFTHHLQIYLNELPKIVIFHTS